jgi:hypothetical protein
MANRFFSMDSLEEYEKAFNKWLVLSSEEMKDTRYAPKARIFVSVEEIEIIQDAFRVMIQTVENLGFDGLEENQERKVMRMGYALEEVKTKLQRRIANTQE